MMISAAALSASLAVMTNDIATIADRAPSRRKRIARAGRGIALRWFLLGHSKSRTCLMRAPVFMTYNHSPSARFACGSVESQCRRLNHWLATSSAQRDSRRSGGHRGRASAQLHDTYSFSISDFSDADVAEAPVPSSLAQTFRRGPGSMPRRMSLRGPQIPMWQGG
jgi:hypothetical protein